MPRADRLRVAAARLTGLAAAHAHTGRLDLAGALQEMLGVLGEVPAGQRQRVLDEAAAAYAAPDPDPWYRPRSPS